MKRRQPARRGLSYLDANRGRLITEGPDVLKIKDEIHARWPGVLECYFDVDALEWIIVEKCKDGVERLALSTKELNGSIIDRLLKMDQATHRVGDIATKLEREADKAERDKDYALSEVVGDIGERLEHALQDVMLHNPKIFISRNMA